MLIPVKCFTCGKVLGDKYRAYERMVLQRKGSSDMNVNGITYLTNTNKDKTPEGEVMDELKLNKYCCRRHMLTHVNIE